MKPNVNTYRLFISIFPPVEYINYFRDILKTFDKQKRNIKALEVDQIHLTVKFVGGFVSENSKNAIIDELQRHTGNYPKPEIKIKGVQFGFKYQDNPRALIATLEETDGLIELADIIHILTKNLGFRDTIRWKDKRFNNFHITIARLKDAATKSSGREIQKLVPNANNEVQLPNSFTPEYIEIIESKITSQGPVYKRLARIRL
jgi:2'-5' RNA ligase